MSAVSKGNAYEIEVKKTLEGQGWQVFRQHRKPMFIHGKMITVGADIFGCDLVGKKTGLKTLWIQVSTVANLKAKQGQVINGNVINLEWEDYEIWLRVPGRREYEIYRLKLCGEGSTHYYGYEKLITQRVSTNAK